MKRYLSSDPAVLATVIVLLVASLFVQGKRVGLPRAFSGDEPHYLLALNSVLRDGDFDLKNNYAAVHRGSDQAGRAFAGQALAHHVTFVLAGQRTYWGNLYNDDGSKWSRDGAGHPLPTLLAPATAQTRALLALPEYPHHPVGSALLMAALLWPVRNTSLLEPLSVAVSTLSIVLCVFFFRRLARRYAPDGMSLNVATLVTFLGTPLWAYARSLFNEPYLALFFIAIYALAHGKRSDLGAGALAGLGLLMKPVFLIVLLPLGVRALLRREFGALLRLSVGPLFAVALLFYLNNRMFGSPFMATQSFIFANPVWGALGLLFHPTHGLLPFAPIVLPVLVCWKRLTEAAKPEAVLLAAGIVLYFGIFASVPYWRGGYCPGPRYLVPLLPALMVPAVYLPAFYAWLARPGQTLMVGLGLMSVLINAVLASNSSWNTHPLLRLYSACCT